MYDLVVGDVISGQIAFNGFYELDLTRRIAAMARKGGLFVDVGANLGYFSLLWLHGDASNRVVAVEASPRNQNLLQRNLERNLLETRCQLLRVAAGDHAGTVCFDVGPEEQTGWGGISTSKASASSFEVQMVRLDEQLSGCDIAVMKIDVEGADTLVIKGCEKLLREKRIKTLFFEQHAGRMAQLGLQPEEAVKFLESLGYKCTAIGSDEWMATVGAE